MSRRLLVAVFILAAVFILYEQRAEMNDILSMGIVTASDHELDAGGTGYFAIGVSEKQGTVIMTPTGSVPWLRLRELRGKKITLLVRVDE